MLEKAIAKIKSEIEKNRNNGYVEVVGNFIMQQLQMNPDMAEKVLDKDKTILKSLDEMKKVAEKKKIGNCAVLTDSEGFAVVLKYFEFNSNITVTPSSGPELTPIKKTKETSGDKTKTFDVKLEDFI